MINTFPALLDRETKELVSGHIARVVLHHEWRLPPDDPQIYTVRDDTQRVGWSVSAQTRDQRVVKCAFCHAVVKMQIHAMHEHSILRCPTAPDDTTHEDALRVA